MNIELWQIGKTKFPYLTEGIAIYTKRLSHYCKFSILTFKEADHNKKTKAEHIQNLESQTLKSKIKENHYIVLLDEKGKEMDSVSFSKYIVNKELELTNKTLVFIIGGAYGFTQEMKQSAHAVLSLSKMTFSHQMIRLFFVEQLYRAFTIKHGQSYHNV